MGLIPSLGRFHVPQGNLAHVPQFLSLLSGACALQQERSPQWEASMSQLESGPYPLQLEKVLSQQWRSSAAKIN